MCVVISLYGIADCVGFVVYVGLLKHSQQKLTEIFMFHRTFYMEVHNVALVNLLAIQVMIVKRSQDVSY